MCHFEIHLFVEHICWICGLSMSKWKVFSPVMFDTLYFNSQHQNATGVGIFLYINLGAALAA
jgi:hypothetical protein